MHLNDVFPPTKPCPFDIDSHHASSAFPLQMPVRLLVHAHIKGLETHGYVQVAPPPRRTSGCMYVVWRRRRGAQVVACRLCGAAAAAHKWVHVGCVAPPPRRTSGCMQVEYALQTSREVCVGTKLKHLLPFPLPFPCPKGEGGEGGGGRRLLTDTL